MKNTNDLENLNRWYFVITTIRINNSRNYILKRMKMNLIELQSLIKKFTKDKNMNSSVAVRIIDLASEVGELSKEVLKGTNYGNKTFEKTEEWNSEIGDVLFALICIANQTETNLEDCLRHVLGKYEKRFTNKGDLGSGR